MKTLLLGMMYSMSEKGLANRLKITEDDALDIMNFFFKTFPNIKKTMKYLQALCKEDGFVETLWGRKRRIPDIWSDTWFIRKKAERQVLNSVIQGTAADVMKLAMIKVGYDQRIKDLGGKLLITVHDELIIEASKKNAVQISKYVIEDMTSVCQLKVPMKVDAEIFVDGRWYGDSIAIKKKKDDWVILYEKNAISEDDIPWAV
jgi:DNA polymerase-1